jgi:hypothetical protein
MNGLMMDDHRLTLTSVTKRAERISAHRSLTYAQSDA